MYIKDGILYSLAELRRQLPSMSLPVGADLSEHGYSPVEPVQPPERGSDEMVLLGPPVEYAPGKWRQTWIIEPIIRDAQMLRDEIVSAVQARLDAFAHTRNYDNILSTATYAASSVPKFASEGQYAVAARDATWAKLYEILGEVESGARPMPTGFADIEPELPELVWPE